MTNFNNLAPVKETTIKGDDFLIFDSLEFRNQSTNNEQITKWTTTRGGDRKSIDYILTIVIHLYTQPLNNRPVKRYEIIFRHVREDFIDITTRARMHQKTHYIGLNLKCWFCQSIKRKTRKQIPPKSGIKRMHYFLFGLASFSRQIAITQAEKLVLFGVDYLILISRDCNSFRIILFIQPASDSSPSSFCAFSIACRNSGSSLNWNGGLPRLFSFMCIDTPITSVLMYLCVMTHYHYIIKKTIAQRVRTSMSYLTTITLIEVMIMANRYDSAPLRAEQSKLFKFYDLSTAQVIQTTATTERQARKNLGKQSLIFIARIRITPIIERVRTWGGCYHE